MMPPWWRRTQGGKEEAAVLSESEEHKAIARRFLEELHSFVREGWEQEDDITLLTLKRSVPLN